MSLKHEPSSNRFIFLKMMTCLKLTCWVCGANPSPLGREIARGEQVGEPKEAKTEQVFGIEAPGTGASCFQPSISWKWAFFALRSKKALLEQSINTCKRTFLKCIHWPGICDLLDRCRSAVSLDLNNLKGLQTVMEMVQAKTIIWSWLSSLFRILSAAD